MSTKPSTTISHAIDDLFADPPVSRDIALQLLSSCIENARATEARIDRALLALFGLIIAFLALDTGILAKISFQGAELQRTGIVLCMVPVTMAYLYYRYVSQVHFVHHLRTVIALLYKNLHEPVFYGGLDMLTHIPSVRMLETYDSFRAPPSMQTFYETTTEVVTLLLLLGPLAAMVYCFFRLWNYPDIGIVLWTITAALSTVFVVRAWLFGSGQHDRGEFANRGRKSEPILANLKTALAANEIAQATTAAKELERSLSQRERGQDPLLNVFSIYRRLYQRSPVTFFVVFATATAAYVYFVYKFLPP